MSCYPTHRKARDRIEWLAERMDYPFDLPDMYVEIRKWETPLAISTVYTALRKLAQMKVLIEVERRVYIHVRKLPVVL